jgi:hypothetical protein
MKLGVFGSRTISDSRGKMEIAEFLLKNPEYDTIVTTQEPKGVCELAQIYAKENSLVLELHFLNINKYARRAFEHRSDNVIKSADFIILIHDGESKGTSNELERVKKFNKPFQYIKLLKTTELEISENTDILAKKNKKQDGKSDLLDITGMGFDQSDIDVMLLETANEDLI